jgi:signal transduction histidine kinase/DNA-binding response OmpR family regulator/ligand-binding sensor domain-containing protein
MKRRTILLICLFIIISTLGAVSSLQIQSYTINANNGLPDNNVRCMAMDKKGFLWLGTPNGLYRFDGYFYTTFRHEGNEVAGLVNNHINALLMMDNGMLLIRQQEALYSLYDTEHESFVDISINGQQPLFGRFKALGDSLWLWNEGGAAVCYSWDSERQMQYRIANSANVPVSGTQSTGYMVAQQLKNNLQADNIILDNRGNPCVVLKDGTIWWIEKESGKRIRIKVYDERMSQRTDRRKYVVATTSDGSLTWVSTNGCGLTLYSHTSGKTYTITHETGYIATNFLVDMLMDEEDNVYVANEEFGITCLSRPRDILPHILLRDPASDILDNRISFLTQLGQDSLLIINTLGDVFYADSSLVPHPIKSLANTDVHSIAVDRLDRMWIGSRKHGLRAPSGRWYSHEATNPNSPSTNHIIHMLFDGNERLWVANFRGALDCVTTDGDSVVFRHFFPESKGFRVLYMDSDGYMWAGGRGSVWYFRPDELIVDSTRYRLVLRDEETQYTDISDIHEDTHGRIWISTLGNGIYRIDDSSRKGYCHFSTKEGLISDDVHSIAMHADTVYIATQRGITMMTDEGVVAQLHEPHRALNNIYTDNTAMTLSDGRVLLGSYNGIAVIDHMPRERRQLHPVRVTELHVNGSALKRWESIEEGPLHLSYKEDNLTFRFSAFNYPDIGSTFYSYYLEGYDKAWNGPTPVSFASYRDLPPGNYRFRLKVNNAVNGEEYVLPFRIEQPWWATWWAICLYVLVIAGIGYVTVHYLRTMLALRQRLKLEKELSEYKMLFFTNISHEFRTPLTIIRSSIERIAGVGYMPKELKEPVSSLRFSTQRMLRLINQLLDFRMAQQGNLKLQVEDTEVVGFLREVYSNFFSLAEQKHLDYSFKMTHHTHHMLLDRQYMDKIAYNLISNAIKYTPSGGKVQVRVQVEDDCVIFSVEDTGIGLPEEQRKHVFDNYMHTAFRSSNSMGIGLHFTRQLVELHHGTITYTPNEPNGSIFRVILPTTETVYSEEERMNEQQRHMDKLMEEVSKTDMHEREQELGQEEVNEDIRPMNDRTVLIVDDEEDLRTYMDSLLRPVFRTRLAADGVDALRIAEEEPIDLIISDVMMSTLDGFELTKRIRQNEKTKSIPIILLSALTSDNKRIYALKMGADAYLTKPFNTHELLTRCQNLLLRHEQLRQSYAGEVVEKRETLPTIMIDERNRQFVEQLDRLIMSNLTNPNLSVEMLADKLHLGRTMFFKQVKTLTGETPADYIRRARMQRAAELLANTNEEKLTVSEVSYRVGIDDPHYFIKLFRKQYGITPKKYQQGGTVEGNEGDDEQIEP